MLPVWVEVLLFVIGLAFAVTCVVLSVKIDRLESKLKSVYSVNDLVPGRKYSLIGMIAESEEEPTQPELLFAVIDEKTKYHFLIRLYDAPAADLFTRTGKGLVAWI